ncbi:MAG: hypothetical protein IPK19_17705 [Chloroflexi bacterium]|nr:hypothetical protein [Chloroflexota bacterium]
MRLEARLQEARAQAPMRLARHYAELVREAAVLYEQGGNSSLVALNAFDAERAQIEQWWAWLAERAAASSEAAKLLLLMAVEGQPVLWLRLAFSVILQWQTAAREVALRIGAPAESIAALIAMGKAQVLLGELEEATGKLWQAAGEAEVAGDRRQLCAALRDYALITLGVQPAEESEAIARRLLDLSRSLGDPRDLGTTLSVVGWIALKQGRWEEAQMTMNEGLPLTLRSGNQAMIALALQRLGTLAHGIGDYAQASCYQRQALEFTMQMGDQRRAAHLMMDAAATLDNQGDFAAAREYYLQAISLTRRLGLSRLEAVAFANLGYSAYLQNQFSDSVSYSESAAPLLRSMKQFGLLCTVLANLIAAYLPLGRFEQARLALQEGLEIATNVNSEPLKVMMLVAAVQTWVAAALAQPDAPAQREMMAEAASWSGMILACPGAEQENRDDVAKLRPQMEAALGVERFMALFQEGGEVYIDDVIADIVSVLRASV